MPAATSGKRSIVPGYKKPITQPVKSVVPSYTPGFMADKQAKAAPAGQGNKTLVANARTGVVPQPSYMSMYAGPAPAGSTMFTPLSANQRDSLGGAARQAVSRAGQGLSSLVSGPYAQMALQSGFGSSMPIEQLARIRRERVGARPGIPMWAWPARRTGTWGDEPLIFHGEKGLYGKSADEVLEDELEALSLLITSLPVVETGGYVDYSTPSGGAQEGGGAGLGASYNPYAWMSKLVSWNANRG